MKLSKILLSSVVAAAMAFGMLGCAMNEDEHEIITVKGDTASINYTNTSDITYRGFRTLRTKHTDAVAVVTIDTKNTIESTDKTNFSGKSGVFGFVIDLDTQKFKGEGGAKKQTYDFTSVTVRWVAPTGSDTKGKLQTYISRFEGVDPTKMDGGNNFKDIDGTEFPSDGTATTNGGKETAYLKGNSTAYATLDGVEPDSNGLIKVAIEVKEVLNDNKKPTGKYTVTYYKGNASITEKKEAHDENIKTGQIGSGAIPLSFTDKGGSATVDGGTVTIDASWASDLSKIQQTEMGFYAGVYPKATLTGSIRLPYILNEDEVIEWDD